jgi:hypothetical protein
VNFMAVWTLIFSECECIDKYPWLDAKPRRMCRNSRYRSRSLYRVCGIPLMARTSLYGRLTFYTCVCLGSFGDLNLALDLQDTVTENLDTV